MTADPQPWGADGEPEQADDVRVMVTAVGSLIGYDGATYALRPPQHDAHEAPVVVRSWRAEHAGAAEAAPDRPPALGADELDEATWQDRRYAWRDGTAAGSGTGAGEPRALSVPVHDGPSVAGVLTFFGQDLRPPQEAELPLFEGIASMLGRATRLSPVPPPIADETGNPLERAIALVDVFAFTVRVSDDASLEWRYFGPNSAAVFGVPVSAEETLVGLVERHAHPEDLLAVHELERAALAGQPREVEIRILGGDGVERWISWRSVPRRVKGALLVDGVATDVSSRHSLGRSRRDLEEANEEYTRQVDLRRRHALAVRDANDNVLQRIFAAGLRLQILRRKLNDVEAHAASTIAFQLDQAATDLRELILDLNAVIGGLPDSGR